MKYYNIKEKKNNKCLTHHYSETSKIYDQYTKERKDITDGYLNNESKL